MRVHQETETEKIWKIFIMRRFIMQYDPPPGTENIAITIRRLKAKILRLTGQYMRGVLLDTTDDSMQDENITTYHYVRSRKLQKHDK